MACMIRQGIDEIDPTPTWEDVMRLITDKWDTPEEAIAAIHTINIGR